MNRSDNPIVELILCTFLGILGVHRFYAKKVWTGLLYLFTFGLLGFGVIVDEVLIIIRLVKWLSMPKPVEPAPMFTHSLWDEWDESVHMVQGQVERMNRAQYQEMRIKKVRKDGTAFVYGSTGNLYQTRFDRCSCQDFQRRNLPCKHMYLYAIKHAGFDPDSVFTME